jgi:peroxiredoxin family protein
MASDISPEPGSTADNSETALIRERISRLEQELQRLDNIQKEVNELRENTPRCDKVALVLFSGELDKVLASLIIASTAASMGMEVEVFFTFWGINVLKERRVIEHKALLEKMIDIMTPAGPEGMPVSQMNVLGAGAALLKRMMKDKNVISAHELLEVARESGVKLHVCSMTMQVMGIKKEELMTDIEEVGAASYVRNASRAGLTLFI